MIVISAYTCILRHGHVHNDHKLNVYICTHAPNDKYYVAHLPMQRGLVCTHAPDSIYNMGKLPMQRDIVCTHAPNNKYNVSKLPLQRGMVCTHAPEGANNPREHSPCLPRPSPHSPRPERARLNINRPPHHTFNHIVISTRTYPNSENHRHRTKTTLEHRLHTCP